MNEITVKYQEDSKGCEVEEREERTGMVGERFDKEEREL